PRETSGITCCMIHGAASAQPITTPKVPPKLAIRFKSNVDSAAAEAAASRAPPAAAQASQRRLALSSCERDIVRRGGDLAASQAGARAATKVAAMPNKAPFSRLCAGKATSRTVKV